MLKQNPLTIIILLSLIILSLFLAYFGLNIYEIYSEASIKKSIENLKSREYLLVYLIDETQDNTFLYQCGVDIVENIGLLYGKEVNQVYVISKQGRCYYNNVSTIDLVCLFELNLDRNHYIIILDNLAEKTIEAKNRALIINPVKIESCSNLFS